MSGRGIGEQRTVGQLFRLIFAWTLAAVGGMSTLAVLVALMAGAQAQAWSIAAAGAAVLISGLITALVAAQEGVLGSLVTVAAYVGKILLIVGFVAAALRYTPADGTALFIALVIGEIVSLITMSVVVVRGEGPGFDLPERDTSGD